MKNKTILYVSAAALVCILLLLPSITPSEKAEKHDFDRRSYTIIETVRLQKIMIALGAYAHDHDGTLPRGVSSTAVFNQLIASGYIGRGYFRPGNITGDSKEYIPSKSSRLLTSDEVGYDFTISDSPLPDSVPLVYSTGFAVHYKTGIATLKSGDRKNIIVAYSSTVKGYPLDGNKAQIIKPAKVSALGALSLQQLSP